MRLFIAIGCSGAKKRILAAQEQLRSSLLPEERATFPLEPHLTVRFLGEVQPPLLERLKSRLDRIRFKRFTISLDKVGFFPKRKRPRVVWLGVVPWEPIVEVHKKTEEALGGLFKKESHFHPHITVARIKRLKDTKGFVERCEGIRFLKADIAVDRLLLMRSDSGPEGPRYTPIHTMSAEETLSRM